MTDQRVAAKTSVPLGLPKRRALYINGDWVESERRYALAAPATGRPLGDAIDADGSHVEAAVRAARAAFPDWRDMSPYERGDRLRALAALMRRYREELAAVDAIDTGNPVTEMLRDVDLSARGVEFFAGLVTEVKGETIPIGVDYMNYTTREPLGVIARIIAYNHPLMFATMRSAAPLAAGNTLIIKPSEQAPLSALRLAELVAEEKIFPKGVFNIVTGGRDAGVALSTHRGIARVAMIGSVSAGKAILAAAAETMKSVGLELGGKNALIAYPDADPEVVAAGAIGGMNLTWSGQSCGSTSRIFLHESHHDAVLAKMIQGCAYYQPGDPADPSTTMGSLIDARQREKVERFVAWGIEDGATLCLGGHRLTPPGFEDGMFFAPTIFSNVTPQMRIARQEIFGPVVSVFKWSNEDELFDAVNSVDYGLTGAVFTRSLDTAHRAARRIEAGYIWVNQAGPHFVGVPFGGYKQSGIGREEAIEELFACTQIKNVNIRLGTMP
jgi:betaine-aldehyde dehydrogenase